MSLADNEWDIKCFFVPSYIEIVLIIQLFEEFH